MKTLFSTLVLLILASFSLQGQQTKLDSMMNEVEGMAPDTAKVEMYLDIVVSSLFVNRDTGVHYIRKAQALSEEMGYVKGQAIATRWMGIAYIIQDAYELALDRYVRAGELFDSIGDMVGKGRILTNIATVHMGQEDYASGKQRLEEAAPISAQVKDTLALVNIYHNLGICYDELGEHEKALELFFRAKSFKEVYGDRRQLSMTLNSIGEVYLKMKQPETARTYLDSALVMKRESGDRRGEAYVVGNLADYYLQAGNADSAEHYLALALSLVREMGVVSSEAKFLKTYALMLEEEGRLQEAFDTLLAHANLNDSLKRAENLRTVANLQAAYQLEQKEQEISYLASENEIKESNLGMQRYFIFALIGGLSLVSLLLALYFQTARNRKRINEQLVASSERIREQSMRITEQNRDLKDKNEEMERLHREQEGMVQMIVHDLKAPLSKSQMLADLVESSGELSSDQARGLSMIKDVCQQGDRLIADLAALNSAGSFKGKARPESVELAALLRELAEGFRPQAASKDIDIHLDLPQGDFFFESNTHHLRRILDNLLSNAIKFSPKGKNVYLKLAAEKDGPLISVRDEGPGFSAADRAKAFGKFQRLSAQPTGGESSTGLGLAIVKALTEVLGGHLELLSQPGEGAEFRLSLKKETIGA